MTFRSRETRKICGLEAEAFTTSEMKLLARLNSPQGQIARRYRLHGCNAQRSELRLTPSDCFGQQRRLSELSFLEVR